MHELTIYQSLSRKCAIYIKQKGNKIMQHFISSQHISKQAQFVTGQTEIITLLLHQKI